MLDDPGPAGERPGEGGQVADRSERRVEDEVALVGAELGPVRVGAHRDGRAKRFDEAALRGPAELDALDRERVARPQLRRQLRLVHHDDLASAGLGDDLLP